MLLTGKLNYVMYISGIIGDINTYCDRIFNYLHNSSFSFNQTILMFVIKFFNTKTCFETIIIIKPSHSIIAYPNYKGLLLTMSIYYKYACVLNVAYKCRKPQKNHTQQHKYRDSTKKKVIIYVKFSSLYHVQILFCMQNIEVNLYRNY